MKIREGHFTHRWRVLGVVGTGILKDVSGGRADRGKVEVGEGKVDVLVVGLRQ